MSHIWPAETVFDEVDLFLHGLRCGHCQTEVRMLGHRHRRVFTLDGPQLLIIRVGHCPDPDSHARIFPVSRMFPKPISLTCINNQAAILLRSARWRPFFVSCGQAPLENYIVLLCLVYDKTEIDNISAGVKQSLNKMILEIECELQRIHSKKERIL